MADVTTAPETTPETPAAPDFRAMDSLTEYRKVREQADTPVVPAEPAAPVVTESPEQEADSQKPDKDLSDAGRALRKNRADVRKQQIQTEINDLVRQRNELRAELTQPRRPQPTTPASAAAPSASTTTFPNFEQWNAAHPEGTYEGYMQAAIADGIDRRLAADKVVQQQQQQIQTYAERAASFKAEHPDYDDVIADVQVTGQMLDAIRESEYAPQIAYHLGTHRDEAARLAGLSSAALYKALGALEARLSQPAAPVAQKPITRAPAPINPIGGSAAGPVTRDPKDINSVSEWNKRRAEFAGER